MYHYCKIEHYNFGSEFICQESWFFVLTQDKESRWKRNFKIYGDLQAPAEDVESEDEVVITDADLDHDLKKMDQSEVKFCWIVSHTKSYPYSHLCKTFVKSDKEIS